MSHSILILALCAVIPAFGQTSDGVTATEIKVGVINVTSGPIASSGLSLNAGHDAYFAKVNREGGVNGRKIVVKHYDDGYEPAKTVELTRKAIEEDKVFVLMDYNGTPTVKAALPIAKKAKIPFLFARTGDPAVREPFDHVVVNLRAGFYEEMDAVINEAIVKRKKTKIAVIAQADGFGDVIKAGSMKALHQRDIKSWLAEGVVQRNSKEVKEAYDKIALTNPEVVVLAVTNAAGSPFVKMAVENGKNWLFIGANNMNPMVDSLKGIKHDTILSQVVPNPATSKLAIADQFRKEMKTFGKPELADDLIAFEGYINAAAFTEAARRAGKDLTRDSLIQSFEAKPFDIGGFNVAWSSTAHNGKSAIFLTKVEDGKFVDLK